MFMNDWLFWWLMTYNKPTYGTYALIQSLLYLKVWKSFTCGRLSKIKCRHIVKKNRKSLCVTEWDPGLVIGFGSSTFSHCNSKCLLPCAAHDPSALPPSTVTLLCTCVPRVISRAGLPRTFSVVALPVPGNPQFWADWGGQSPCMFPL